jgi:hypothetical protein
MKEQLNHVLCQRILDSDFQIVTLANPDFKNLKVVRFIAVVCEGGQSGYSFSLSISVTIGEIRRQKKEPDVSTRLFKHILCLLFNMA